MVSMYEMKNKDVVEINLQYMATITLLLSICSVSFVLISRTNVWCKSQDIKADLLLKK